MIYLSAQPNTPYFIWQLKVQINNFKRLGIDLSKVYILLGYQVRNEVCDKFISEYRKITNIISIPDTRKDKSYIPSLRPHIISKFFKYNPELQLSDIFYHDCDILFFKIPNFDLLNKDSINYLSDTCSYISSKYIRSKGEEVLQDMCKIVGINIDTVIKNDLNAGGAQYLLKGTSEEFWKKVELDSTNLFNHLKDNNQKYASIWLESNPDKNIQDYHSIQYWCADMWAVLWNLLSNNKEVKLSNELSFSWATSPFDDLKNHNIFHNAGVEKDIKNLLFFKAKYIKESPFLEDFTGFKDKFCSKYYVDEINLTKEALKRS